jgi:hypothetical protein
MSSLDMGLPTCNFLYKKDSWFFGVTLKYN